MKLVIIESPYAPPKGSPSDDHFKWIARHVEYARRAMADCLARGEAPYASHLLYTQDGVLDDSIPAERKKGMEAGFAWGKVAELVVIYDDYGISGGMKSGVTRASNRGIQIEYRSIGKNPGTEGDGEAGDE